MKFSKIKSSKFILITLFSISIVSGAVTTILVLTLNRNYYFKKNDYQEIIQFDNLIEPNKKKINNLISNSLLNSENKSFFLGVNRSIPIEGLGLLAQILNTLNLKNENIDKNIVFFNDVTILDKIKFINLGWYLNVLRYFKINVPNEIIISKLKNNFDEDTGLFFLERKSESLIEKTISTLTIFRGVTKEVRNNIIKEFMIGKALKKLFLEYDYNTNLANSNSTFSNFSETGSILLFLIDFLESEDKKDIFSSKDINNWFESWNNYVTKFGTTENKIFFLDATIIFGKNHEKQKFLFFDEIVNFLRGETWFASTFNRIIRIYGKKIIDDFNLQEIVKNRLNIISENLKPEFSPNLKFSKYGFILDKLADKKINNVSFTKYLTEEYVRLTKEAADNGFPYNFAEKFYNLLFLLWNFSSDTIKNNINEIIGNLNKFLNSESYPIDVYWTLRSFQMLANFDVGSINLSSGNYSRIKFQINNLFSNEQKNNNDIISLVYLYEIDKMLELNKFSRNDALNLLKNLKNTDGGFKATANSTESSLFSTNLIAFFVNSYYKDDSEIQEILQKDMNVFLEKLNEKSFTKNSEMEEFYNYLQLKSIFK